MSTSAQVAAGTAAEQAQAVLTAADNAAVK